MSKQKKLTKLEQQYDQAVCARDVEGLAEVAVKIADIDPGIRRASIPAGVVDWPGGKAWVAARHREALALGAETFAELLREGGDPTAAPVGNIEITGLERQLADAKQAIEKLETEVSLLRDACADADADAACAWAQVSVADAKADGMIAALRVVVQEVRA